MREFFGKYRGTVVNNVDPHKLGRLQVSVPDVLGDASVPVNTPDKSALPWAMPCVPYAGPGVGFYMIPPVGAKVWVEFECGDLDYPVWSGCFWEKEDDVPAAPAGPEDRPKMKVLKTDAGTLTFNENDKSITIVTEDNMKITLDPQKILIDNGQGATIEFKGHKVSTNGDHLEVT